MTDRSATTPGSLPRLLIVDDDIVDRMSIVRGLRSAGLQVECVEAASADEAFRRLAEAEFDCIFLDYHLPDQTGFEVLKTLRGRGDRTPIVMLTGQGDEELAVQLMKAGASDYLPKGTVSADRLAQSFRSTVRIHHAESNLRAAEEAREAALAARSRFYAAMSHELRTPINAILGYNDLLLAGVYGELNTEQARGLDGAQRAARHLLELVNDVLDLSKLEAGKMDIQIEEVDVPSLVQELFGTIRPLTIEHGCRVTFRDDGCLPRIRSDPRRLRQILLNLLSNAIKYGAGRPVEVCCVEPGRGEIAVEVRDEGPGIAPEDLPRIFDEFVQIGEADKGGTGLGLPISRRLAELLHGRLEAESTVGVGSTFRIVLPLAPPESAPVGITGAKTDVGVTAGDRVGAPPRGTALA